VITGVHLDAVKGRVVNDKVDVSLLGEIAGEIAGEAVGVISICVGSTQTICMPSMPCGNMQSRTIIGVGRTSDGLNVSTSIPCITHRRRRELFTRTG
jgi:hypothetical protein